jgi:hypothetical protein
MCPRRTNGISSCWFVMWCTHDPQALLTSSPALLSLMMKCPAKTTGGEEIPDLLNWVDEAVARLVVLVEWAVRAKQYKRVVTVSNDMDTFAILLYHTSNYWGWMRFGSSMALVRIDACFHCIMRFSTKSHIGVYIDWRRLHKPRWDQTRRCGLWVSTVSDKLWRGRRLVRGRCSIRI